MHTGTVMVQMTLQAVATPNKSLIGTNCIYVSSADLATLGVKDGGYIQVKSMVFCVHSDPGVSCISPAQVLRGRLVGEVIIYN